MDTESHLSKCQANPHPLSFQNYLCFCCHSTGRDYSINASSSSPLKYINPQILVSQATNLAQVTFSNRLHPDFDRLKLAHNNRLSSSSSTKSGHRSIIRALTTKIIFHLPPHEAIKSSQSQRTIYL